MIPKEKLSGYLKEILTENSNLKIAAGKCGIPYDRFVKSLQRNTYSENDINSILELIPFETIDELESEYSFDIARTYSSSENTESSRESSSYEKSIKCLFQHFPQLKKLARNDGELVPAITTLYENWHGNLTMVLFSHPPYDPVEWDISQKATRSKLLKAVREGGVVIYIFENTDEVTGQPYGSDKIDDEFEQFMDRLKRENADNPDTAIKGLVALLRVPHCSFCIPYQKPTLLYWPEDGDLNRVAITTAQIPETTDGSSIVGTLLLPQREEVSDQMLKYLERLCSEARKSSEKFPSFRAKSFPSIDQ